MMKITTSHNSFTVSIHNIVLIRHSIDQPAFFVGVGTPHCEFFRGNFRVFDTTVNRVACKNFLVKDEGQMQSVWLFADEGSDPIMIINIQNNDTMTLVIAQGKFNRIWIRICNEYNEALWGGGEQFSHLNVAGKRIPIWTQEPGVGRDLTTRVGQIAEIGKACGHDTLTYYPQPTFISSRGYALHVDSFAYAVLDFTSTMFHEIELWDKAVTLEVFHGQSIYDLVKTIAERFGHSGSLPEWVFTGAIVGLKRGIESIAICNDAIAKGLPVSGLWCEDWCGIRETSFGTRLFWNWEWSSQRYPNLPYDIELLNKKGVKFLGYCNPYLCTDGNLYQEALSLELLTKKSDGAVYTADFGEFECGYVDFTNPVACQWYKDRILKKNMIQLGIAGWMADFGEYQPVDMHVYSGENAWLVHNKWPLLWAKLNSEAVAEDGVNDTILFFMRAGFTGSQRYCKLLWTGDQSVDFSRHDGMETAICAALSAGLVGNAVAHSDMGGYTTLFGNVRTQEVFMRWAEMATFTPVMRTHEGNRPYESFQFFQSNDAFMHFVKTVKRYSHLVPYLKEAINEAIAFGIPVQRPLFLHYNDTATYSIHNQYLYGRDLLVAPVHASHVTQWQVYLPKGEEWVHVWTGKHLKGGQAVVVDAPIGNIPVFYRSGTKWEKLFTELTSL